MLGACVLERGLAYHLLQSRRVLPNQGLVIVLLIQLTPEHLRLDVQQSVQVVSQVHVASLIRKSAGRFLFQFGSVVGEHQREDVTVEAVRRQAVDREL